MANILIDSTNGLNLFCFSDDWNLLGEFRSSETKIGSQLQSQLYKLCLSTGISISEIKRLFAISGPGSYTGIRFSEGLLQVSKLFGVRCSSFYHYLVPLYLEVKSGVYCVNAFKGELYIYTWGENLEEHSQCVLVKASELNTYSHLFKNTNGLVYTSDEHTKVTLEKELESKFDFSFSFINTLDLILTDPKKFFLKYELKDEEVTPFYFRPDTREFKTYKHVV